MNYKGYQANIGYSDEDECFVGKVLGIRDIIGFHGSSVEELKIAFHEAIDFYLETNVSLQKPASGRFMLRLPPEIHAKATYLAERSGKSLNQWVVDILGQAV
jgi:predicted HicB family RNase H-like nuclease